jgi:hypothetical protein
VWEWAKEPELAAFDVAWDFKDRGMVAFIYHLKVSQI